MGFSPRRTTGVRQSEAVAKVNVRVRCSPVQSSRPDVVRAVHVRSIDQESIKTDSARSPDAFSFASCDEPWV